MAEEIVFKIDVDSGASLGEIKDLKKQFAEAEDALFQLAGAGKQGTEEFKKAQLEAAKLKERVDDINESLDDLKPEARLGAFTRVASGVASGFTAATGAAALFGAESADLEKQLLKVQAALAFSEGLRGLGDLTDGFKVLKTVILANPLLTIATILTTIGVALFALKDKIKFVGDAFNKLGEVFDFVIEKIKAFTDWLGISDFEAERVKDNTIKRNEEIIASNNKKYDAEIRAAKRARKETEDLEIAKAKSTIEANEAIINSLDERVDEEKKRIEELKNANYELSESIKDFEAAKNFRIAEANKAAADKAKADREKRIADELKMFDDLQAIYDKEDAQDEQIRKAKEDRLKAEDAERRKIAQQNALDDAEFEAMIREAQDEADEINKNKALARIAEEKAAQQESWVATQALADGLLTAKINNAAKGSAEEAKYLKQQFELNKKFQTANAIMNGIQAVQAIMAVPDFTLGIASAIRIAAAIATSVANVAKIRSTKFNATAPTSPSTVAPVNTTTGGSTTGVQVAQPNATLLNPDGTIKGQEQTQMDNKVYVVESDITKTQNKVAKIKEQAAFS